MSKPSTESNSASLKVPLTGLAMVSFVVALACLTTLVTVVSIKNIDALSTVALALAIVAFVVQLIVFTVQAAETARQSSRGYELHSAMMSVLAQLQERTQGTQRSMDRINARLLDEVLGKAADEGLKVGTPEFAERVASGMQQVQVDRRGTSSPTHQSASIEGTDDWPDRLPEEKATAVREEMMQWPPADSADRLRSTTASIDDPDLDRLVALTRDLVKSTRVGAGLGPGLYVSESSGLVTAGLVEKVPGWKLYTLSPEGRLVGRLLTAEGPAPAELSEFQAFRSKALNLRSRRD